MVPQSDTQCKTTVVVANSITQRFTLVLASITSYSLAYKSFLVQTFRFFSMYFYFLILL